ncbi:MAG: hypothetical protein V3S69_03645 [Dehalococcoidales bacterium]
MKEATHIRKGKNIIDLSGGGEKYKSFNAAKRASRKIQMNADGALGRGTVQVRSIKRDFTSRQLSPEAIQRIRSGR